MFRNMTVFDRMLWEAAEPYVPSVNFDLDGEEDMSWIDFLDLTYTMDNQEVLSGDYYDD